jgi:3-hydroxyisobutyrate dehydrogenase-like beta-hydroxyacid dehydrogenase
MSDSLRQGKAAVLGLGVIGCRAYTRLVKAGWQVACWNRTPKGVPHEAASPEEAMEGAEIISVYLKDAPAVREVMLRIEACFKPGQWVLNHATVDLETTLWLAEHVAARGCGFLDAPFTGSRVAAENGQLVYYIGGDPDRVPELQSYLTITSKSQLHCGGVGSATVVKLATNLISACSVQAMAEALAIATRHGVGADCFIQAVSQNASASVLGSMKLPAMASGNYDTHFSLSNMAKDSRYVLALAESAGLETPAISAVSKRMNALSGEGLGDLDFSVLAKPYLEHV